MAEQLVDGPPNKRQKLGAPGTPTDNAVIFPTPVHDPAALRDRVMGNPVSYAREVEGDTYETANSRDYDLDLDQQQKQDGEKERPQLSAQEERRLKIQRCIQILVHATHCREINCQLVSCAKMKRVVEHAKTCKRKTGDGCRICLELIHLCCYHAKHCLERECVVPFCRRIKLKLRQQQTQQRFAQSQTLRRPMATMQRQSMQPPPQVPGQTMPPNMGAQAAIPPNKAPFQILARGPDAIEAYNRALEDGMRLVKRVPVMLIGQDRTGKTSLLKSLKGQPFDPNERSTVGIETDPSHFKVSKEIWKAGKEGKDTDNESKCLFEYHAAQLICQLLKKEKSLGREKEESFTVCDINTEELETYQPQFENVPKEKVPKKQTEEVVAAPLVPELPEDVASLVEMGLQNFENIDDEDEIYSVLWDFAGQSVYYATHPIFLTEKAIYILACDLSRSPDEKLKAPLKKGLYKDIEDVDCRKTNQDYLDFWLSSVYSLVGPRTIGQDAAVSKVSTENLPPVFLVCTHADQPYREEDPRELALEIYGRLQDKIYREHLFKDVFVVDNTKSGSGSECPEVVRLRKEVLAVAKNLPQMKEAIPLKWLRYEDKLQLLREKDWKWIHIEKARQIAIEECQIDDNEQVQTLLHFLHDLRILIHFDETPELDNMVILDPQWLIDVFKQVITVPRYEPTEHCVKDLWENLQKTGILDERLLDHAWKPLFDNQETCKSLLAIMERFSLLCPCPSDSTNNQYLVPSMLLSPPTKEVLELLASVQIPSLFVRFESGRVPPGLFSRLVLQFYQRCNEEWKSPVNPDLFHNFAVFHIRPDQETSVILLCHSSFVEVAIHTSDDCTFDPTTGPSILRQLRCILEYMRKEFHWLKTMSYEMCVCCPLCSQKGSPKCRAHDVRGCECLHLLSESELDRSQICPRPSVFQSRRIDINMFKSWFSLHQTQDASGLDPHEGNSASSKEVKDGNPTNEELQRLARKIVGNWKDVGRRLNFEEFELIGFDKDNAEHNEKAYKMLLKWKQREGAKNATYQSLEEALCPDLSQDATGRDPHKRSSVSPKEVKDGNPTDDELQRLSIKIVGNWKNVARRLNFEESELTGFDKDNAEHREKAYKMLLGWKRREGAKNATYQSLEEALRHDLVGRTDLAEEFCYLSRSFDRSAKKSRKLV